MLNSYGSFPNNNNKETYRLTYHKKDRYGSSKALE